MFRVKSVTSGDSLVLADSAGERFVSLAYVSAPRVDSQQGGFCGRELLRSLLVGKSVQVRTVYTANERDFVDVRAPVFDSLVEKVLRDGAAKLRDDAPVKPGYDELASKLEKAQEVARTARKGIWGSVPVIRIEREAPEELFGSGRQVPAIVEKVVSGDRAIVRALMDPDHHFYGLCSLAGIRCPRSTGPNGAGEPFGDAARDLVAQRLLQRDIRCVFVAQGTSGLPLVTLVHPAGDIASSLLQAGLARYADQQTSQIGSQRSLELRKAEGTAKAAGVNLWKSSKDAAAARSASAKTCRVHKVLSGDTFVLENERTVQLSSVVAPRKSGDLSPWLDQAKEYARALVIGHEVEVLVDGERTDNNRELVTMALDGKNVAEHIVAAGYAMVRGNQSPFVAELSAAEAQAKQQKAGIWGRKPAPSKQVDASESQVRAKAYLSALERRGRIPGVVDYASPSGARLRVVVPSENCVLSVVCAGIKVPRQGDKGAEQVTKYVGDNYLQRDVEIKVYGTDKTGAFAAQTWLAGRKQSLTGHLLSEGLASVFEPAANDYGLRKELDTVQQSARNDRKGIWADWVEPESEDEEEELEAPASPSAVAPATGAAVGTAAPGAAPARANYQDARITWTTANEVSFRLASNEAKFRQLSEDLTKFFTAGANSSAYSFSRAPRRNDLVVLKQGTQLSRAQVVEVAPTYELRLIDSGATVEAAQSDLRPLPQQFAGAELAQTVQLAYVSAPPKDYLKYIQEYLGQVRNTEVVVSQVPGAGVIVYTGDSENAEDSLNTRLIDNGYTYMSRGSGPLYERLKKLETACIHDRVGIWEYGDPRDDE